MEKGVNNTVICRQIFDLTDELRDSWFQQESRGQLRELLSLTVSQSRMLSAVWRMTQASPDGVILRDLAEKLSLSNSAVSVMVESLVQRGYLERVTDKDDRRKVKIRIAGKGCDRQRVVEQFFISLIGEFVAVCDDEKLSVFQEVLIEFNKFLKDRRGETK